MYSESGEKRRQVAEDEASNKRQKEETLEGLKAQLIGLNKDFASWVAGKLQNNPDDLWTDGAMAYATHADKLAKQIQQQLRQSSSARNSGANHGAPFGSPSPPLHSQPAAAGAAAAAPIHVLGALSPRPNAPAFAFPHEPHHNNNNGQASGPPTPALILAPEGGPGSGPASPFGFGAAATPPPASRTPGGTNTLLAPLAFTLSSGTGTLTGTEQAKAFEAASRNPFEKKATAPVVSPMFGGGATTLGQSGLPTPAAAGLSASWGSAPSSGKGFSFTSQTASATAEAAAATTPSLGWGNGAPSTQPAPGRSQPELTQSLPVSEPTAANQFAFGSAGQPASAAAVSTFSPLSGWAANQPTSIKNEPQPPSIFAAPVLPAATTAFAFGSVATVTAAPAVDTSTSFGFFGSGIAPGPAPAASAGFGFGAGAGGFGSGSGSAAPAVVTSSQSIPAPTAKLFNFGAANTSGPAAASLFPQPAVTGFNFGSTNAVNPAAAAAPFGASMFSLPSATFAPSATTGAGPSPANGDDETEPAPQDEFNKEPMQLKANQGSESVFRYKSKCFVMDNVSKSWTDKGVGNISLYAGDGTRRPYLTFTTESGKVLFCVNVMKSMKIILDEKACAVKFTAFWAPDPKDAPLAHLFMMKLPKGKPVDFQQSIEQLQEAMAN